MELRLAVSNRTAHHLGNFIMLKSFHIVEHKNRSIAGRQAVNRPLQLQAINGPSQLGSSAPNSLRGASSSDSRVSSSETDGNAFLRSCIGTTLTVMRCGQVEKAIRRGRWQSCGTAEETPLGLSLPPAKDWTPCANIASTRASCGADTGSRRLLRPPCFARSIASVSVILRFRSVKSPFPAATVSDAASNFIRCTYLPRKRWGAQRHSVRAKNTKSCSETCDFHRFDSPGKSAIRGNVTSMSTLHVTSVTCPTGRNSAAGIYPPPSRLTSCLP